MSTIDFNKPLTSDLYTAWPTSIQGNQQSLGFMLDPTQVTAYTNLSTGMKRLNGSNGLFEAWSGSAWAAQAMGYVLKAGDTMTGALGVTGNVTIPNSQFYAIKNSGGTASSVMAMDSANQLQFGNSGAVVSQTWAASGTTRMTLDSTGLNMFSPIRSAYTGSGEQLRLKHDAAYIGFWNAADSTRSGYIQGNASSGGFAVIAENGSALQLGSNSTIRWVVDTSGQLIGQPSSSYVGHNGTAGGITLGANGTLADGTARIELYDSAHATLAKQVFYRGDVHTWTKAAAATTLMQLDGSGNLACVGGVSAAGTAGFMSTTSATNVQNPIWRFGNALAYGMSYFQGTSGADGANDTLGFHFGTATAVGSTLQVQGAGPKKGIIVKGGATTLPNRMGNVSGAVTLDCSQSNVHTMTLIGNMTSLSVTNITDGQTVNVIVKQDATGSRTWAGLIAANGFIWPGGTVGVLSTPANSRDVLCITFDATDGKFYCTLSKAFA